MFLKDGESQNRSQNMLQNIAPEDLAQEKQKMDLLV